MSYAEQAQAALNPWGLSPAALVAAFVAVRGGIYVWDHVVEKLVQLSGARKLPTRAKPVKPELQPLCDDLLSRFNHTEEAMLSVMKHSGLLSAQSTAFLQQKLQLRAPYVAPLNILQVYCLKTLREVEAGRPLEEIMGQYKPDPEALAIMSRGESHPFVAATEDTMVITMKGIAAGMQNTG